MVWVLFFLIILFVYFIFGCDGSLLLRELFSSCAQQGLLSSCEGQLLIAVAFLVAEQGL